MMDEDLNIKMQFDVCEHLLKTENDVNSYLCMRHMKHLMSLMFKMMKEHKKELQDAQAHQRCKEKRRQERLAESEEAAKDSNQGRRENGQEAREVQETVKGHISKVQGIMLLAKALYNEVRETYGERHQIIPFAGGKVTIEFDR